MDSISDQKRFSDDRGASFPLLSDAEGRILEVFGVGLDRKGFPLRETFLLKEGKVVWHDPFSSTRRLARDALQAIDGYPPPILELE